MMNPFSIIGIEPFQVGTHPEGSFAIFIDAGDSIAAQDRILLIIFIDFKTVSIIFIQTVIKSQTTYTLAVFRIQRTLLCERPS